MSPFASNRKGETVKKSLLLIAALLMIGCGGSDEEYCIHHYGLDVNGVPYSYYTGSCGIENVVDTTSQEMIIQFDDSFLERR